MDIKECVLYWDWEKAFLGMQILHSTLTQWTSVLPKHCVCLRLLVTLLKFLLK